MSCRFEIRASLTTFRSIVESAISRSEMTGSLSLSRSTVSGEPSRIIRERWEASSTSSNRFGTFSMQSSTVTRAISGKSPENRPLYALQHAPATHPCRLWQGPVSGEYTDSGQLIGPLLFEEKDIANGLLQG